MLHLRLDESFISLLAYHKENIPTNDALNLEGLKAAFPFSHCQLRADVPMEQSLKELHESHPAFSEVQPTQVMVNTPITLVPISSFEEDECTSIYNFCVVGDDNITHNRRVFYDMLPASNAVLLFALGEDVCKAIEAEFGEVHYVSSMTGLLRRFGQKNSTLLRRRMYLHCREHHVDIAVYEDQRILVINSYEVHSATDIAYYAFNLAQSLGLENDKTSYMLCGDDVLCDAAVEQLSQYVPTVGKLRPLAEFNRHPLANLSQFPFDLLTHIL